MIFRAIHRRWNRTANPTKGVLLKIDYAGLCRDDARARVVRITARYWDIFMVGRFRNFERSRTVAKRTPGA